VFLLKEPPVIDGSIKDYSAVNAIVTNDAIFGGGSLVSPTADG
jgi:hypothetical protein